MAWCYSAGVTKRQRSSDALPAVWLVSDARNDAGLSRAIARLPRGSGVIFRHRHLEPAARRARFDEVLRAARARGCVVVLAGGMGEARAWGADGAYGAARVLARGGVGVRLVTAHSLREIGAARRADAVVLSPVFATRSHVGSAVLGAVRWLLLARRCRERAVALGGMDAVRARRLGGVRFAAIDGLSGGCLGQGGCEGLALCAAGTFGADLRRAWR